MRCLFGSTAFLDVVLGKREKKLELELSVYSSLSVFLKIHVMFKKA